jgi:hypothetical protein
MRHHCQGYSFSRDLAYVPCVQSWQHSGNSDGQNMIPVMYWVRYQIWMKCNDYYYYYYVCDLKSGNYVSIVLHAAKRGKSTCRPVIITLQSNEM